MSAKGCSFRCERIGRCLRGVVFLTIVPTKVQLNLDTLTKEGDTE